MKPTIYLTNRASITQDDRRENAGQARQFSGPKGQHYTIMLWPSAARGELGDGRVWCLAPASNELLEAQGGRITAPEYRRRYLERVRRASDAKRTLRPGLLSADRRFMDSWPVQPDSTLFCACSRDEAAAGRCHRVWAAGLLLRAGWRVVLDGRELTSVDDEGRPVWAEAELAAAQMLPGMEGAP